MTVPASRFLLTSLCCFFLAACGGDENPEKKPAPEPELKGEATAPADQAGPAPVAAVQEPAKAAPSFWDEVKVHTAIREKNPDYTGNAQVGIDEQGQPRGMSLANCRIRDISFMAGMPMLMELDLSNNQGLSDISVLKGLQALQKLYLENTAVKDVSPLKGKRLEQLYLTGTLVKDLTPFGEMQLKELNLVQTPVTELKGLAGAQIGLLWLTGCPVEDISGLEKVVGLESVTLHKTNVKDLSPLAKGQYPKGLRLHIGETPVTDLTPLGKVPLTRLIFTPATVEKGIDAVKALPTLREIGTKFDDEGKDMVPPAAFWQSFEAK